MNHRATTLASTTQLITVVAVLANRLNRVQPLALHFTCNLALETFDRRHDLRSRPFRRDRFLENLPDLGRQGAAGFLGAFLQGGVHVVRDVLHGWRRHGVILAFTKTQASDAGSNPAY